MNIRFLGYSRIDSSPVFYLPAGKEDEIFCGEVQKQGKYTIQTIRVEEDGSLDDISGSGLELIGFYDGKFGVGSRSGFSKVPGHPLSKDCFFYFPDFLRVERLPNVIKDFEIEKIEVNGRFIKLYRDRQSPAVNLLPGSMIRYEIKDDFDLFTRMLVRREKLIKLDEIKDSETQS